MLLESTVGYVHDRTMPQFQFGQFRIKVAVTDVNIWKT